MAGAAGYGAQCAGGGDCSWSGLGSAVASGTQAGAIAGGIFGAAGGGIKDLTGGRVEDTGGSCMTGGQSFTAGTLVLLASGKAVPISSLSKGEKVMAVNTKTGKNQAEPVAAVLVHHDTDLYDLTVKSGGHTEIIHTTSSHLFWDPATDRWVKASALKKGEHLRTPDGKSAAANGGTTPRQHDGWMWDLTIRDDHDFYVLPAADGAAGYHDVGKNGVTAVLAHNCSARAANGRFARDPNAPEVIHDRSTEYPHDFRQSTKDIMAARWTDEGRALGGTPVDATGARIPFSDLTWRDPNGMLIASDDLTFEHVDPVVEHWNDAGFDASRAERNDWFNDPNNLVPMTRSDNLRGGAFLERYSKPHVIEKKKSPRPASKASS